MIAPIGTAATHRAIIAPVFDVLVSFGFGVGVGRVAGAGVARCFVLDPAAFAAGLVVKVVRAVNNSVAVHVVVLVCRITVVVVVFPG